MFFFFKVSKHCLTLDASLRVVAKAVRASEVELQHSSLGSDASGYFLLRKHFLSLSLFISKMGTFLRTYRNKGGRHGQMLCEDE